MKVAGELGIFIFNIIAYALLSRLHGADAAQAALLHRAKMNGLAALGLWRDELEREAVA